MESLFRFILVYWIDFIVGLVGALLAIGIIVLLKRITKEVKNKNSTKEKTRTNSKVLMAFLLVIMMAIVLVSFFVSEPRFTISNGVIYLLGLMIFVVFFDAIEDFSIANIITLKKAVKEKKEEVNKLSSENTELRTQLASIVSASIHNQNLNNVVLGFGDSFLKYARVEQVSESDSSVNNAAESSEETDPNNTGNNGMTGQSVSGFMRSQFFRYTERSMIVKYAALKEVPFESVQQNVRFANYLDAKDPIMEHRAIFDGYIKRPLEEVFIETTYTTQGVNSYYRWYYMISLILQYAKTNQKSAKLVLLIPKLPDSVQTQLSNVGAVRNVDREIERVRNNFQPAIQNGFLEIVPIELTEDECAAIFESLKAK